MTSKLVLNRASPSPFSLAAAIKIFFYGESHRVPPWIIQHTTPSPHISFDWRFTLKSFVEVEQIDPWCQRWWHGIGSKCVAEMMIVRCEWFYDDEDCGYGGFEDINDEKFKWALTSIFYLSCPIHPFPFLLDFSKRDAVYDYVKVCDVRINCAMPKSSAMSCWWLNSSKRSR